MTRHRGSVVIATMMVLLGSFSASADVTISVTSAEPGLSGFSYEFNSSLKSGIFAGALLTQVGSGTAFDSYCIDLNHQFSPPTHWQANEATTFTNTSDSSNHTIVGSASALAYLYNTYSGLQNTGSNSYSQNTLAAALQIALWTVEYDGNNGNNQSASSAFNFHNISNTTADKAAITLANSYITAMQSVNYSAQTAEFYLAEHVGSSYQDLIGPSGASPTVTTPEPSTLVDRKAHV